MFPINSLFSMTLLALVLSRVPRRHWSSSCIVVLVLGLMSIFSEPMFEDLLTGADLGWAADGWLVWMGMLCGYSAMRAYEDLKNPPDKREPTPDRAVFPATEASAG